MTKTKVFFKLISSRFKLYLSLTGRASLQSNKDTLSYWINSSSVQRFCTIVPRAFSLTFSWSRMCLAQMHGIHSRKNLAFDPTIDIFFLVNFGLLHEPGVFPWLVWRKVSKLVGKTWLTNGNDAHKSQTWILISNKMFSTSLIQTSKRVWLNR